MSTSYFVAADWLIEHGDDPEVQIIDARMAPPGQEHRDVPAEYRAGHLPGAVFFDIEALSDHTSSLPHMLPRPEAFSVAMRELGISKDKHLVVYDEGNLFSAPRAWWMLKNFGVEKVSILAGGLAGVLVVSHEKTAQIVDARPAPRFNAEADEPRPGLKRGHIPGALNVPWGDLVFEGELKTTDELRAIFERQGVDLHRPVIASCGSGVTACVVILALATLGANDVTLYDGAWSEWGARDDLPVEPAK